MPEEQLTGHDVAQKNCRLTFEGTNLQAFLIGRQICVTCCMFVIARITSIKIGDGDSIFHISDSIQAFVNTGLLGAVITTIVGSLAWRIIASSFPIGFLSNPLVNVIIHLCLMLEKSGICSASWVLAFIQKQLFMYDVDEEYLGAETVGGLNTRISFHESIELVWDGERSSKKCDLPLTVIDQSFSEDALQGVSDADQASV
eukprot:CAMPEP_0196802236 /NCGR_PEP_ID=MMETSP1362-20130617/1879_1 /TAXON_ID=163516 /ORGANISM="Leptocylindrus danicus, Strain CCMP1856" /LENGTH=200 /DNA_ID=CAMNT_0042173475 /DNA_START=1378 /DNA_END=1980 /DNA_ORIENTATION=-